MIWRVIGSMAAVLTMFSFLPQIVKIIRKKSASDVSLATILQLSLGVSLWIAYGIARKDLIIIIANVVTLSTLVILLYLYFNYAKGDK
jgi:MtN3 and saliva related transmembrane protein